jgi:hypothetical protein
MGYGLRRQGSAPLFRGGRLPVESVAGFPWNQWQLCRGIGGSFAVESVAALPWNTHTTGVIMAWGEKEGNKSTKPRWG